MKTILAFQYVVLFLTCWIFKFPSKWKVINSFLSKCALLISNFIGRYLFAVVAQAFTLLCSLHPQQSILGVILGFPSELTMASPPSPSPRSQQLISAAVGDFWQRLIHLCFGTAAWGGKCFLGQLERRQALPTAAPEIEIFQQL